MSVDCTVCGNAFEREIPADLRPRFQAILHNIPPVCTACCEALEEVRHLEWQEQEERRLAEVIRQRRLRCGMPERLRGLAWGDLDVRHEVREAGEAWAAGELPNLVLTGGVGVLKTWTAATAAWARLQIGPLRWYSVPVLFARLGAGFGNPQREQALDALTGPAALVLDDLDKVRETEYAAEHVFAAIDSRIDQGAGLLVTTNLKLSAIATKFPEPFGEAIASRLAGHCEVFELAGEDRRLAMRSAA